MAKYRITLKLPTLAPTSIIADVKYIACGGVLSMEYEECHKLAILNVLYTYFSQDELD